MADVHAGSAVHAHQHALLMTVVALIAALVAGAGAVVLYYEVIDSDVVLTTPEPVVRVITPEQVAAARALDQGEAARLTTTSAVVVTPRLANQIGQPTPARVEGSGRIPPEKK